MAKVLRKTARHTAAAAAPTARVARANRPAAAGPAGRKLTAYRRKRDFSRTPEPQGGKAVGDGGLRFVVQKHAASHLHYDFRLELNGVLLSWAVPKGPCLDPSVKRLAVHVEDHPLDYVDFEGRIPEHQYGGGTVMVWDRGTWVPEGDPVKAYAKGHLAFELNGSKLRGGWSLVKTHMGKGPDDDRNWLLIKRKDKFAGKKDVLEDVASARSGRKMEQIAAGAEQVWRHGEAQPTGRSPPRGEMSQPGKPAELPGSRRAPMPAGMTPELATRSETAPDGDAWLHEVKFDGYRIVARFDRGRVRLITRNGNDWTAQLSSLAAALEALPCRQAMLDGEAVALTSEGVSSFQALQNILNRSGASASVAYYAFDLTYLDGYDLSGVPLVQRKELLRALIAPLRAGGRVQFSDHMRGGGAEFLAFACRSRLEGIVCKKADSAYRQERSRDWIKVKCVNRQEFVIGGFTQPGGSRTGFGALLLGVYDGGGSFRYCGRVGTGFDQRMLTRLVQRLRQAEQARPAFANPPSGRGVHWVRPELVAEVSFTEWTEDGALRHPSFQGLREDKAAAEVRREEPASPARTRPAPPARPNSAAPVETRPTAAGSQQVHGVRLTHPDRVLYPEQGITKLALVDYYASIASWVLPHLTGRPLMIVRCPKGHGEECFHQKHVTETLPPAVQQVKVKEEKGRVHAHIQIADLQGLLSLVQMGALEFHPWGCRSDNLERPDRMIFDLDPAEGLGWSEVLEAARRMRDLMASLKLSSYVRTTGGKGLHVVIPLAGDVPWERVSAFAAAVVRELVTAYPDRYIGTMSKAARKGRIFVDHFRNSRGATAVGSYSTRARHGAPVATPLAWNELTARLDPAAMNVQSVPARLARRKDPWEGFLEERQTLTAPALAALRVR